jgi:predicted RNase H-like nuclease (RuvC/YqgF family)
MSYATPRHAIVMSSSSIIATTASEMFEKFKEMLTLLQRKVSEIEAENAELKAENARLKKYEIQILEMKYGKIQSTPLPGGFMGYGGSEWCSNAAAGK